ncbi:MAG: DUF4236 domain-containing protein [Hyphomicrobiales bacterium]|nr:MAG: DUF4236 domain-containing protein [Hyphomicrobiales bacterium]
MAIRFRKSIKIAPGVKLNLGKKGGSVRLGPKNAGITVGTKKTTTSASIPGTGLGVSSQSRGGCAGAAAFMAIAVGCASLFTIWPPSF